MPLQSWAIMARKGQEANLNSLTTIIVNASLKKGILT